MLAAYIIGIGIGECVVFCVVQGVCLLRERVVIRIRRKRGWSSGAGTGGGAEEIDEWEEVERPKTPSVSEV